MFKTMGSGMCIPRQSTIDSFFVLVIVVGMVAASLAVTIFGAEHLFLKTFAVQFQTF